MIMSSAVSFEIAVPDEKLRRLQQKLALVDFPGEAVDDQKPWARGVPLTEMKRLVCYWQDSFDWKKTEGQLNRLPQYITRISVEGFETYDIHFVHQRSKVSTSLALLFIHGWPGSFIEVSKMLPSLVDGEEDSPSFHVVAPSLVDFGFSSASNHGGFNIDQHAEVCHKLMLSLGYDEYVIQAGDLGYLVARFLSQSYGPKHVKVVHLNGAMPAPPPEDSHVDLTASDFAGLQRTEHFNQEGNGYVRIQATKPHTLGYSLADSPVGLLAWIYEKLHDWTDAYAWTDDEILTWVSIYYFSKAGSAASNYLYYEIEHRNPSAFVQAQKHADVPLGIARFEHDLILLPIAWNSTLGPIVRQEVFQRGGHFAAWERPEAIVGELRKMFDKKGALGKLRGSVWAT